MASLKLFFFMTCLGMMQLVHAKKDRPKEDGKKDFVVPPLLQNGRPSEEELGKHPRKHGRVAHFGQRAADPLTYPATFNAATHPAWANCTTIRTIRDQGQCGTCWAVSAASVLSDRLCIATGKDKFLSGNQVAGCTYASRTPSGNCNAGGAAFEAYKRASLYGIPTGGEYNSNVGCVPYTISGSPQPITCAASCTNAAYSIPLPTDTSTYQVASYWVNYNSRASMTQPLIDSQVDFMKKEIYNYGPITASIDVYSDFSFWDFKTKGPYDGPHTEAPTNATYQGGHAVRVVGWNVTASNVPYWIIANSWGTYPGDKGYYYIKMGSNIVGIEQDISAPMVTIPGTICSASTFCSAPIDQATTLNYANTSSPQYLFQGSCALKVKTVGGKLVADGSAQPISSVFMNIQPPLVNQMIYNNGLSLLNTDGLGGYNCAPLAGSTKVSCSSGTWSFKGPRAYVALPSGDTFAWTTQYPTYVQKTVQSSLSYSYVNWKFNPSYTLPANYTIKAFLSIDATKAYVFAKDGMSGNPLTGIMTYPNPLATGNFTWSVPLGSPSILQTC